MGDPVIQVWRKKTRFLFKMVGIGPPGASMMCRISSDTKSSSSHFQPVFGLSGRSHKHSEGFGSGPPLSLSRILGDFPDKPTFHLWSKTTKNLRVEHLTLKFTWLDLFSVNKHTLLHSCVINVLPCSTAFSVFISWKENLFEKTARKGGTVSFTLKKTKLNLVWNDNNSTWIVDVKLNILSMYVDAWTVAWGCGHLDGSVSIGR